jgi:hypothetical protein
MPEPDTASTKWQGERVEDPKTIKGFWWRPGEPDTRWFGILEQSGSDIELTCYSDTSPIPLVDGKPGAAVHGRDEKGRPVTLLAIGKPGSSQSGGMDSVRLDVGYVLLGVHVTDRESFKVKAADVRMQQLYGWLGLTGFNRRMNATSSANVTITYDRQDWKSHLIGSCGDKVCFGLETNHAMQFQSQKIEEEATVSFESDEGFDFQKVWDLTTAMRTLLHFAILKPVHTVTMRLRDVACSAERESTSVKRVEVWSKNFREPKTELPIDSLWVFRFADFADSIQKVLSYWLEYQAKYEEALGCYTTTIYSNLTSPVKNLCLTQALDAYHGVRFGSHSKRGLKKKLEELCSLSKTALAGLVDDIPSFAEQARDTRDYFTHHNPEDLKRNVVTGATELIRLNEKLKILFQSLVLMDIGVSEDRLIRLRRQIATEIVEY